jgi:NitT/TauT family transport system permease protein
MAGIILVPLGMLVAFSAVTHVAFTTLFDNLGVSVGRIFAAFIISVILGWSCSVAFYNEKRSRWAFPIFDILQSFPTYAALPLAVAVWGPTNFTVIFFLVLAIIWPIFFSITSSLKLIRRDWVEAVHLSRLSGWQYIKLYLAPITVPGLVTGSIIGLGNGWEALVATEIIAATKHGLGPFFVAFSTNAPVTFVGILTVLAIVFAINKLFWLPVHEWSHELLEE